MFPTDIIGNLAVLLSYNDYQSLILTCKDYYSNNETIKRKRTLSKLSSHSDLYNLFQGAIFTNDTYLLKLILEIAKKNPKRLALPPVKNKLANLIITKSTSETFELIIYNIKDIFSYFEMTLDGLYDGSTNKLICNEISERVIACDRSDIIKIFIKKILDDSALKELFFRSAVNNKAKKIVRVLIEYKDIISDFDKKQFIEFINTSLNNNDLAIFRLLISTENFRSLDPNFKTGLLSHNNGQVGTLVLSQLDY